MNPYNQCEVSSPLQEPRSKFSSGGAKEECVGDFFFFGGGAAWELLFNSDNAIITIKLLIFFLAIGSQNLKYYRL